MPLHLRSSSSAATSLPLSLPFLTFLSSCAAPSASLFPHLFVASLPASSLLTLLASSLSAHPIPAAVAYLCLLLVPASPLLSLFSPLPFLSLLLALRKATSHNPGNPNSGSSNANLRKHKNQRQPAAPWAPSLLLEALSLLPDAAGRLPLGPHPDARRSLIDTAAERAAFDVLAAVLGSDFHTEAVPDVIRALAPVVLSGGEDGAMGRRRCSRGGGEEEADVGNGGRDGVRGEGGGKRREEGGGREAGGEEVGEEGGGWGGAGGEEGEEGEGEGQEGGGGGGGAEV